MAETMGGEDERTSSGDSSGDSNEGSSGGSGEPRLGRLLEGPLYRSGRRVGERVWITHPEIEAAVMGVITGEVAATGILMIRLEATGQLVMCPTDLVASEPSVAEEPD